MAEEQKIAPEADSAAEENHIIAERRAKLQLLRDANAAYPNDFRRKDYFADLHAKYDAEDRETFEASEKVEVQTAGRIMLKRVMGKVSFLTVKDMTGTIQYFVTRDALGERRTRTSRPGTWVISSAPPAISSRRRRVNSPFTSRRFVSSRSRSVRFPTSIRASRIRN